MSLLKRLSNTIAIAILLFPFIFVACSIPFFVATGVYGFLNWVNPIEIFSLVAYFKYTGICSLLFSLYWGFDYADECDSEGYVNRFVKAEKVYRDSPCFKNDSIINK